MKLTFAMLVLCSAAFAQTGIRYQSQINVNGLPNPTVRVCQEPATGNPCSPLATLFLDSALSVPLPNPFTGDSNGNYFFYANSLPKYHIQVFQNGVLIFEQPDVTLAASASGISCGSAPAIVYQSTVGQFAVCDPSATLDGNGDLQVAKIGVGHTPAFKLQVETGTAGDAIAKFKNTDPTGFGAKFIPGVDTNYGIAVGNQSETANNFTVDGLGNVISTATINAPTGTFATINTTGAGFVQTFQTQSAPSVPPSGQMSWYGDSGTNKWSCINHDGSSCAPGGAAWSGTTAGTNANAGTFAMSGNTLDLTAVVQVLLRKGAGLTTSADGGIGYDTTNKMWHAWQNGADNFIITALASGTYTNGDCTSISKVGSTVNFVDSGGACGAAGSATPLLFSAGAQPSTTVTDFVGAGVLNTTEAVTQIPVTRSGTVSNLQCRSSAGLSSAQTMTMTVRKGAFSASFAAITSADTAITCQENSTNTNGCNDLTHNFAVVAGDVLDIKTVPANSPVAGTLNCSVQLQ